MLYHDVYTSLVEFLPEREHYLLINELKLYPMMKKLNFRVAAYNGCLEIIKTNIGEKNKKQWNECLELASKGGHLEVVKWFYDNGVKPSPLSLKWACKYNHINIVKYLLENGIETSYINTEYACMNNNLDLLKLLNHHGLRPSNNCSYISCSFGFLDIVKYLHSLSFYFNEYPDTCVNIACKNGHLEVVKYLHSINVTITDKAIQVAVVGNHLYIIKYLCSIGIVPNNWSFRLAKLYEREDILEWFNENSFLEIPLSIQVD